MKRPILITYLFLSGSYLSAILHNLIYAWFKVEEVFFFILTFVLLLGFVVIVIYNIYTYIKRRKPADIWKLGFVAFFGLAGLIGIEVLYVLFLFLAFFALQPKNKVDY